MTKKKNYKTEDGAQIAPLSELSDFQVADGYRDIRGWRVDSADGKKVGKVHDLLVDLDGMRTRYLDVRLESAIAATKGDRDVLVPIGTARIADDADVVVIPLDSERVSLLPPYEVGPLTRTYESEVRRHFTLGERGLSDEEAYNDRRFFEVRPKKDSAAQRDIHGEQADTRIRIDPEDSVVLKRGEGGRDEIIVRRPHIDEKNP